MHRATVPSSLHTRWISPFNEVMARSSYLNMFTNDYKFTPRFTINLLMRHYKI